MSLSYKAGYVHVSAMLTSHSPVLEMSDGGHDVYR